ncbi:uncharacterized protein LOC106641652 [Copidosoma floridanum]|uniref:uncharacterized protein LOC106641652 n=1 Tax=Copidosoma floridanum TaxID=29053 RepID=UPI0006C97EF3|nr:uncharacterized protein LOC106641652 [Copidosoma floridanum]
MYQEKVKSESDIDSDSDLNINSGSDFNNNSDINLNIDSDSDTTASLNKNESNGVSNDVDCVSDKKFLIRKRDNDIDTEKIVDDYEFDRKTAISDGDGDRDSDMNTNVKYVKIRKAMLKCLPEDSTVSENEAVVPLQSLLNKTVERLCQVVALDCEEKDLDKLVLFVTGGFDRSADHTYAHK